MPSVDTNVLVRLLAADDARQSAQAKALMQRAARTGESLFVPLTVVLELEWVLRSRYEYAKEQVLATLSSLLETRELVFQDEAAVEHALAVLPARQGRLRGMPPPRVCRVERVGCPS